MMVAASWSGGKESALACYKTMKDGLKVAHLLNFVSDEGRCMSHGFDKSLVEAQSKAMGVSLVPWRTSWKTYAQDFKDALVNLRRKGVEGVVFGDIAEVPGHEGWINKVCGEVGVTPIKPLWGMDSMRALGDLFEYGFEARVVATNSKMLDKWWLGRKVDRQFVEDIRSLSGDLDPCGEMGEYHTLVTDCPMYKSQIRIIESRKVLRNGHWFLDITEFEVKEKTR